VKIFNVRIKKKLQWRFVDLPNQEVVNPSQSDEIFKDISKNDISNKIVRNEGLKVYSKSNRNKITI
jgi:hypothetical protein